MKLNTELYFCAPYLIKYKTEKCLFTKELLHLLLLRTQLHKQKRNYALTKDQLLQKKTKLFLSSIIYKKYREILFIIELKEMNV